MNKHHYLSSTHSLFHNREEPKVYGREQEEKTKTVVEDVKMKKMKKKKAISKGDILEKAIIGAEKSEKTLPIRK